ncbi:ankyrin repeat domain-containing protein [Antrihabitans cavernicola]|uniref:Ankyrin repeat domain-containing protein n=1 Tax=Antrihabitans cavernicola TaxID=2495913 RepID=A0A5A7S9I5_9NOCA|nr:ankyrin repeat domain-containing protein [Spelaeibacter cavernicola]KAA0022144.1 ankyrin repeat domain-containing protein [Spelaeibacter cavernicola]
MPEPDADQLLRLACLNYTDDRPEFRAQANAMIVDRPELAKSSIHTIAAVGDVTAAHDLLARDPSQANAIGGPNGWPPLLYLVYSRIGGGSGRSAVEVARLLLAAGADPEAGFLWEDLPSPFTALTGAFGGGEQGQPPHHQAQELARLILQAGADPNDNQALYNRMFEPADDHLELLFEFGLGTDIEGAWRKKLGDAYPSPTAMVQEQLRWAAAHNMPDRVRLLLEHGVDPDGLGYHPVYRNRTAHQLATAAGNREIAQLLADGGATVTPLDDPDRLIEACLAGDGDAVDELQSFAPQALRRAPDLMVRAAYSGRLEAVRLAVQLGADIDATTSRPHKETALHAAAQDGHAEIAQFLVDSGADTTIRDRSFDGTPLGWAQHCGHADVEAVLQVASS